MSILEGLCLVYDVVKSRIQSSTSKLYNKWRLRSVSSTKTTAIKRNYHPMNGFEERSA